MRQTIGQVAKKLGVSTHTLRYYDKEGLLPFIHKTSSGLRVFSEKDLEWLSIIECLKGTGLSLKEIKQFIDWCIEGDATINKRLALFVQQKSKIEQQISLLHKHMEKINFKIAYYKDAAEYGNTDVLSRNRFLAEEQKRIFGNITGNK